MSSQFNQETTRYERSNNESDETPEVFFEFPAFEGIEPSLPDGQIDLNLYFGMHLDSSSISQELKDSVKSADVFLFETIGWTPQGLNIRQRIADGDPVALKQHKSEIFLKTGFISEQKNFYLGLLDAIYSTGVRIHIPDAPADSQESAEYIKNVTFDYMGLINKQDDLSTAREIADQAVKEQFDGILARDKYIIKNILPSTATANAGLNVVGFFGMMHCSIADQIAIKSGESTKVKRTFTDPLIDGANIYRRYLHTGDLSPADYARAAFGSIHGFGVFAGLNNPNDLVARSDDEVMRLRDKTLETIMRISF